MVDKRQWVEDTTERFLDEEMQKMIKKKEGFHCKKCGIKITKENFWKHQHEEYGWED
jgi:hypothetical protein